MTRVDVPWSLAPERWARMSWRARRRHQGRVLRALRTAANSRRRCALAALVDAAGAPVLSQARPPPREAGPRRHVSPDRNE